MPYDGEFASKSSHHDIVKNPDVARFLSECEYLKVPSDNEGRELAAQFSELPPLNEPLPEKIIAFDGSPHESQIDNLLPSTKVVYVKVGSILIDLQQFGSLRVPNGKLVDPFKVAELKNNNDALTFTLPSANIRWRGKDSVRDGFRAAVDDHFYGLKTRFRESDPTTSLRTTLFHLASRRASNFGTKDPQRLMIHKCPTCAKGPVEVRDIPGIQFCHECGAEVYPTDCLRLWEQVSDYQSNLRASTIFMNAVEHLLPIHYMRYLLENSLSSLGSLAFFIDGPLATFDVLDWVHGSIMSYLSEVVNERLIKAGYPKLLIIGLQKTGQVVDHVKLIERFVERGRIFAINDDYRYQFILTGRDPSQKGFGSSTYYGQDFIYKTQSGRVFVFALPYPFASKSGDFINLKTKFEIYPELARALVLINHFETDLYKNAVVPVALAHRYTAISLAPGGRVLDLLTRKAMKT